MIWGVLGTVAFIAGVAGAGYSLYDIFASGAYKDMSIGDWLWNIAYMLLLLNPIFDVLGGIGRTLALIGGFALKFLSKIPLLGSIATWIHSFYLAVRSAIQVWGINLFGKGGWLFRMGNAVASLGRAVVRHPWLMFGLIFSSTMFDGLLKRIFQLWGDLSLRAMNFAFERLGTVMSDNGYGDPVSQAVGILDGSVSSLPPCFTSLWQAVGASECIGLIITTFQYLFLLSALVKGYKVYGR